MLRIIAGGRSFPSLWLQKQRREVLSPTVDNSSSPLPGVPPASGTAAEQKPPGAVQEHRAPQLVLGHSLLEEAPHENAGLSSGRCVVVLGPLSTLPLWTRKLLHAARLHLSTDSRAYRCLLLFAGKIPPATRNSTCLSFSCSLSEFQSLLPARTQPEDSWQESSKWDSLACSSSGMVRVAYSASKSMWLLLVSWDNK